MNKSPEFMLKEPAEPAEFGVEGELAWLPWVETLVALAAVLAAYMLASSWNFPIFFLYLILLFPNQLDTCETVIEHFFANSSLASSLG